MKRLRRFLLFAGTLASSAVNQWRITGQIQWRAAPKILAALWAKDRSDRKVGSVWWRRMRGCQRCHIYDRRRRACGHLGMTYQRGDVKLPLGCNCFMPVKSASRDPEVKCWLFEQTGGEFGVDWTPTAQERAERAIAVL